MITPNPFIQAHAALWSLLESHPGFAGLVTVANRLRAADPALDADLPRVRIVPAGSKVSLFSAAHSAVATQTFYIELAAGARGLDQPDGLFALKWETLAALARAFDPATGLWLTLPGVRDVAVTEPAAALTPARSRPNAWSAVLAVHVEFTWRRA